MEKAKITEEIMRVEHEKREKEKNQNKNKRDLGPSILLNNL